jgi:hypothetical protein
MVCKNNNVNKQNLNEVRERVQGIDLERITRKVQRKLGWDVERANQAEQQYRHYLALLLLYPDRQIAPPSNDADEIWHGHILDTPAYQQDCEELFGAFLHHLPSYGSAEEKMQMAAAREETEALYERHFGSETNGEAQEEPFCICMAAKPDKAQEEAFCVCMAAKPDKAQEGPENLYFAQQAKVVERQTEGCVPCLGRTGKHKEAAQAGDGCVPCLGRTGKNKVVERAAEGCVPCFGRTRRDSKLIPAGAIM